MAYTTTDIEELVSQIDIGNNNQIYIKKIFTKDKEFKALDIRRYYFNEKSGEMRPTPKGVRIKYEDMADFVGAILMGIDYDIISTLISEYGITVEKPE